VPSFRGSKRFGIGTSDTSTTVEELGIALPGCNREAVRVIALSVMPAKAGIQLVQQRPPKKVGFPLEFILRPRFARTGVRE